MIEVCRRAEPESPEVVFDDYIPVTITWPEAHRLLAPPRYLTFAGPGRLLELKFHPYTRRLVEAVLVSAAGVQRGQGSLNPASTDRSATACSVEDGGSASGCRDLAGLVAYDDCLVIGLLPDSPTAWVGNRPVLVGLARTSEVVALCLMWEDSERELLLSIAPTDGTSD